MNKADALKALRKRKGGVGRKKGGNKNLTFTIPEKSAVRTLATFNRSQLYIAHECGLTLAEFKRAMEKDSELQDAWNLGVDEARFRLEERVEKIARDKDNPRAVQAVALLAKMRYGIGEGRTKSDKTTVNVNVNAIPQAQDPRTYQAIQQRITKKREPVTIEHEPTAKPIPANPVKEVFAKQKEKQ
jgi:hypothetical protein